MQKTGFINNTGQNDILKLGGMNTIFAFIIAYFSLKAESYTTIPDISIYFALHQIYFHLISFGCAAVSIIALYRFRKLPLVHKIIYTIPFIAVTTILTSLAGMFIVSLSGFTPGGKTFAASWRNEVPETLLITFTMMILFFIMDQKKYTDVLNGINNDDIKGADKKGMEVRENGNTYFIPYVNILYISAHGKISVVHTIKREYKLSRLIRELAEVLPADFFRIHKSFIVNLTKVIQMKYFSGGSYTVLLNDDEKTTLPVSRSVRDKLKKKIFV